MAAGALALAPTPTSAMPQSPIATANGRARAERPISARVTGTAATVPTPAASIRIPKPDSPMPRICTAAMTPSDIHMPRISERSDDQPAMRVASALRPSAPIPCAIVSRRPRRALSRGGAGSVRAISAVCAALAK
jgi:hypothetical protein